MIKISESSILLVMYRNQAIIIQYYTILYKIILSYISFSKILNMYHKHILSCCTFCTVCFAICSICSYLFLRFTPWQFFINRRSFLWYQSCDNISTFLIDKVEYSACSVHRDDFSRNVELLHEFLEILQMGKIIFIIQSDNQEIWFWFKDGK